MQKLAKIYLILCWIFFIFKITSFPVEEGVEFGFSFFDKFVHLFLFAVLTYLLLNILKELLSTYWLAIFISALCSSIYAMAIEYHQLFVPGRFTSEYDFLAGVLGSVLVVVFVYFLKPRKSKLLLHVCCAGCGVYIAKDLQKEYEVILYFYNPNIYSAREYDKRLKEANKIARKFRLKLTIGKYDHKEWLNKIKGHEKNLERGERCRICYRDRLESAAHMAKKERFNYFTSTLTISPHKDAKAISEIGKKLETKYGVKFYDKDFKKQNGFKKSVELSKELGLYRQEYCGCEFSKRIKRNV
ncbi:MAG: epoxyqueuosine reductase QueH [Patescibacteria group bacterium]